MSVTSDTGLAVSLKYTLINSVVPTCLLASALGPYRLFLIQSNPLEPTSEHKSPLPLTSLVSLEEKMAAWTPLMREQKAS